MDVVKVTPDPLSPNVTITNILDAANTLIIDTAAGTSTGTLGTGGLAPSGTPVDGIRQTLDAYSALFATRLPNPADPALLALFSSTFMHDGLDSSVTLSEWTAYPELIGVKLTSLVVDSVDTATGIARIHYNVVTAVGENIFRASREHDYWRMKQETPGGPWLIHGNQRITWASVRTITEKSTCNPANAACSTATSYRTGLYLETGGQGAANIGWAVVTGPGLPPGGVTLVSLFGTSQLHIITPNPSCGGCTGGQVWDMTDTEIAAVTPGSIYTVMLFDNAATPALLATYTEIVPVAPALNTAVAALAYPSITGMIDLAGRGAVTLTPSWSVPGGLKAYKVSVTMYSGSVWQTASEHLFLKMASSGTSTLVINAPATGTWTNGFYVVWAEDQYDGQVKTYYQ